MGSSYDSVPVSAIIRIRDMMHTVKDPFRLDQGDVSFDAPDSVKQAMAKAIAENQTHYLPTTGVPRAAAAARREDAAARTASRSAATKRSLVTNGGTHGIWAVMHALFEPGDEVIVPDPEWPPTMAIAMAAKAMPVAVPLHERLGWRWDLDELEQRHHAADARDLRELAEQPDRRRPDARRPRAASPPSRRSATSGCSRTKPTRTSSSTASTSASRRCRGCTSAPFRSTRSASRTR